MQHYRRAGLSTVNNLSGSVPARVIGDEDRSSLLLQFTHHACSSLQELLHPVEPLGVVQSYQKLVFSSGERRTEEVGRVEGKRNRGREGEKRKVGRMRAKSRFTTLTRG